MKGEGNLIRNMGPNKLIFQDVISHICDWQSFINFAVSKFGCGVALFNCDAYKAGVTKLFKCNLKASISVE